MAGEAREKCAVAGVIKSEVDSLEIGDVEHGRLPAAVDVYESLFAMQHRGTEASGIATIDLNGRLKAHRGPGMVRDVFNKPILSELGGVVAVGQNRYSTSGTKLGNTQPLRDTAVGYAFAHNGNLPQTDYLDTFLEKHNVRADHINDSAKMSAAIVQHLRDGHDLPSSVELAYPLFQGAFSCVAVHDGILVAFRDQKGIRPLALGKFRGGYAVASETCGLDINDFTYMREVEPGELVIISSDKLESKRLADPQPTLDIFEFVYFARHDSQLYGQRVNEVRRKFGEELAEQHPPITDNLENVVVIPVPDTSVPAAEAYAAKLKLEKSEGIIKNRYIGRTFILPGKNERTQSLRRKHNIIPERMKGRDVIIIDDSIVRLNTLPRLVKLAYLAGAKSVSTLIASPPVRFPDYYGIDTPEQSELAAANMTVEEMRNKIGCQYLGFLSVSGMIGATGISPELFNMSCFTGNYPIDIGNNNKSKIHTPVSMQFAD